MAPQTTRFGPYELVRRLGAGGMAEAFLAVRRGPGGFEQRVCVKRPLPAYEDDAEFVRMFMEEARICANLRHANIVQVLDFGEVDGSHFLTLELVEGMDLRDLLRAVRQEGRTLPASVVAFLAFELAKALDFAHDAGGDAVPEGVVHRDISPGNVLLSRAGEVKLTDFGIARAADTVGVTTSGVVKGKVPYMAPEYARTGRLDARGDLYALGVTLYQCLAGKRPHDGVTEMDTLERAARGDREPLARLAPEAPAALVAAIERLLSPDPEARFLNAEALLDGLAEAAPPPAAARELAELVRAHAREPEDLPAPRAARPGGTPSAASAPAGRPGRGRRTLVVLAVVAAVLAGVAIALLATPPPAPSATLPPPVREPPPAPMPEPEPVAEPEPEPEPEPVPEPEPEPLPEVRPAQARPAKAAPRPAALSAFDQSRVGIFQRSVAACADQLPAAGAVRTTATIQVARGGVPNGVTFQPAVPDVVRRCIIQRGLNMMWDAQAPPRPIRIRLQLTRG